MQARPSCGSMYLVPSGYTRRLMWGWVWWGEPGDGKCAGGKVDELETQVGGWDTHGAGYVLSDVRTSQRRSGARRGLGAVSDDRGGVGDFCFVVCEVEVGGRWRSEQRRADGLEMPRWRQRAIGKITSHLSRCRTAASLRKWLPPVLRAQMRNPPNDKRARVIHVARIRHRSAKPSLLLWGSITAGR